MKQHEAVIEAMKQNGGYATLGWLYQNVLKINGVEWKTKTPFATIRRIVQDDRFFFRIRPGLWALKEYRQKLPSSILVVAKEPKQTEYSHTYYQGLLVEIGNMRKYSTYVPVQDKNRLFLMKPLSNYTTIDSIYRFGYEHFVKQAKTIDVVWFNDRKMPNTFFEVEHSTNFQNALVKFMEFQDFNVQFRIVADKNRKKEYLSKISNSLFKPLLNNIKFIEYEKLSELHSRTVELSLLQNVL